MNQLGMDQSVETKTVSHYGKADPCVNIYKCTSKTNSPNSLVLTLRTS